MADFAPIAVKSPKIAKNQHEWYFQNSEAMPFQKLIDFLIFDTFFYKGPADVWSQIFCTIPFNFVSPYLMTPPSPSDQVVIWVPPDGSKFAAIMGETENYFLVR